MKRTTSSNEHFPSRSNSMRRLIPSILMFRMSSQCQAFDNDLFSPLAFNLDAISNPRDSPTWTTLGIDLPASPAGGSPFLLPADFDAFVSSLSQCHPTPEMWGGVACGGVFPQAISALNTLEPTFLNASTNSQQHRLDVSSPPSGTHALDDDDDDDIYSEAGGYRDGSTPSSSFDTDVYIASNNKRALDKKWEPLLHLSTREINQYIKQHRLSSEDALALKKARRRGKSRLYTRTAEEKRRQQRTLALTPSDFASAYSSSRSFRGARLSPSHTVMAELTEMRKKLQEASSKVEHLTKILQDHGVNLADPQQDVSS
jgi:hypothetical protein